MSDDDLRRRFDAAAGDVPDAEAGLVDVRRKVRTARRRRAAVWTGAGVVGAAMLTLVVTRGPGISEPRPASELTVASTVETTPDSQDSTATTAVPTSPPPSTTVAATVAVTSASPTSVPPTTGVAATAPAPVEPMSTPPALDPAAPQTTSVPTGPPVTEAPATSATPVATDSTYSGVGGSVHVQASGGQLVLVSHASAPGFTAEVHDDGPSRVEVRFRSADHETVVRVELIDGVVQPRVQENGG